MNSSNNFNSQFNSMNNSTNNSPMQPVKNRFFNQDLFNDTDLNDVGSSTSNQVTNWGVQNESSNVDYNNMLGSQPSIDSLENNSNESVQTDIELPKQNQFSSIFSQALLEDVNATVYEAEPEVLDDSFLDNNVVNDNQNNQNNMINNNDMNLSNSDSLFGYTENEVLDISDNNVEVLNNVDNAEVLSTDDVYNNQDGVAAPIFNQNVGVAPVFDQNAGVANANNQMLIDQNVMAQQPLSMNSLGATPMMQEQIPDVVEDSKYFPMPNVNMQNQQATQNNQPVMNVMPPKPYIQEDVIIIDELALTKAYIGKSYDKCLKSNFSLFALLFGSFAFFCKKMYFTGLIFFVLQVAVLYYFRSYPYIILAAFVIIAAIMALLIYPFYLFLVKRKVHRIRKRHPKVSQGDLNNLCAKRGRNNVMFAFLLQIILLGGSAFLAVKLLGVDYFKDIYKDVINMINKPVKETKFTGELKYSDLDIEDYFSMDVPTSYEKKDDANFSYYYLTEGVGEYNTCSFKFGGVDGYKDASNLINKIADYYELSDEIDTIKYNDLEWYLLYVEDKSGKIFYRATDVDNHIIVFEFKSGADTPDGVCESQIVLLLDSIDKK